MAGSQSSSSFAQGRGFWLLQPGADHSEDARSTWILAVTGLVVAACAAGVLGLSPRWFPDNIVSLVLQAARIVLTTAAIAGGAVWALWYVVSEEPSSGAGWIVRNLSLSWVFLPAFVLFYEARSAWMLAIAPLVAVGFAVSLRRLLPVPPEPVRASRRDTPMPSLNGLPRADSPLLLAACAAALLEGAVLTAGFSLLMASLPLAFAVFLVTWWWAGYEARAAAWWGGRHPPLRQFAAALAVTSLLLVPYTLGEKSGLGLHTHSEWALKTRTTQPANARSGYFGIILYPPPKKKELLLPPTELGPTIDGGLTQPLLIPFDGPYLYFNESDMRPGPKAHVAHGKPTDAKINVRSTDEEPLLMEAHQKIGRPIRLAACGEIDVVLTNADTRPGEIDLALVLADSSTRGRPRQVLAARQVISSLPESIPQDRAPVKEVLRFAVPAGAHLRRFDDVTVQFILAPRHARTGAKISVESFELIPRH